MKPRAIMTHSGSLKVQLIAVRILHPGLTVIWWSVVHFAEILEFILWVRNNLKVKHINIS